MCCNEDDDVFLLRNLDREEIMMMMRNIFSIIIIEPTENYSNKSNIIKEGKERRNQNSSHFHSRQKFMEIY